MTDITTLGRCAVVVLTGVQFLFEVQQQHQPDEEKQRNETANNGELLAVLGIVIGQHTHYYV